MRVRHASSSSGASGSEVAERRRAADPAGERAAGEDARRVDGERAEQPVDVVGDAEGRGARVLPSTPDGRRPRGSAARRGLDDARPSAGVKKIGASRGSYA